MIMCKLIYFDKIKYYTFSNIKFTHKIPNKFDFEPG